MSSVLITASALFNLGTIAVNPVTVTFDANGAGLLIVVVARTNNVATGPATFTYAGLPLSFVSNFAVRNTTNATAMDVAFLARPPVGHQALTGVASFAYSGSTEVYVVGLTAFSGVIGINSAQAINGSSANFDLTDSTSGSLLLGFLAASVPVAIETPNAGWIVQQADIANAMINAWIITNDGGVGQNLTVTGSGSSGINGIVLEFYATDTRTRTISGSASVDQIPARVTGRADNLGTLTPAGQQFHIYWESWKDVPVKNPNLLQPDDFFLARIPGSVQAVVLCYAKPLITYAQITDDLKTTVGIDFPGSATLLRNTLGLLRHRNPGVQVLLAIRQDPTQIEPFTSQGWAGVTSTHTTAIAQLATDLALDGIVLDYEVISANPANHCRRNDDGTITCYTDNELVQVIKTMRSGLSRPFKIILDGLNVGAYGLGDYLDALPDTADAGYNVCVANDSVALAALDAIHIKSFDAGRGYDPRIAVRAFQAVFPNLPLYLGVRVGPIEAQNVKQTARQIHDFCNTAIMLGLAGVHLFAGMWDVIYLQRNVATIDAPFGNYGRDFVDANIAGAIITEVLQLGIDYTPAGTGYVGRHNQLRINNRPPAVNLGVIGSIW